MKIWEILRLIKKKLLSNLLSVLNDSYWRVNTLHTGYPVLGQKKLKFETIFSKFKELPEEPLHQN